MLVPPQSLQMLSDAVMLADARAPAILSGAPLLVVLALVRYPVGI